MDLQKLTFQGVLVNKSVEVIFHHPSRVAKILSIYYWCAKK